MKNLKKKPERRRRPPFCGPTPTFPPTPIPPPPADEIPIPWEVIDTVKDAYRAGYRAGLRAAAKKKPHQKRAVSAGKGRKK